MRRSAVFGAITALASALLALGGPAPGAMGAASGPGAAVPSPPRHGHAAIVDPPTITPLFNEGTGRSLYTMVRFTLTQSGTGSDAAKWFAFNLDQQPPFVGQIPTGERCSTARALPHCSRIVNGTATVTLLVTSVGPHLLWAYERNAAGGESDAADSQFTVATDPVRSYTGGASLAANFAAAVAGPEGNAMISSSSGASCGGAGGDGSGDGYDAADLTAAGWRPGQPVTVDGATFTLPAFGGCQHDNLLAANEKIGTGPGGAHASSVLVLAASTDAAVGITGVASGSPDSDAQFDFTAPAVPGGSKVTGSGCYGQKLFDDNSACEDASGLVNYASGCRSGGSSDYSLYVPGWTNGPTGIAAVSVPHLVTPAGTTARAASLYVFAVPVFASCTITSVFLPDVGPGVTFTVGGVTKVEPALHILGLALRDTTTATPGAAGTAVPAPAGHAWTGAFESPVEDALTPPAGQALADRTARIRLSPGISAPAGTSEMRIRLSDPGFLAGDGAGPLVVGAASIAPAGRGAAAARAPVPLTFGGQHGVTIPEGGDAYSDPLALPFNVTAGKPLLVSLWLRNATLPSVPQHSWASGAETWFASPAVPNETGSRGGAPFTGTGAFLTGASVVLTGVDVTTPAATVSGQPSPGAPTVVVAGDNVIDGGTAQPVSDAADAPSQRLAGQLASQGLAPGYSVVDAGIEAGQVLGGGAGPGGVNLLDRVDRDILAEPDVGTVIIDEGLEDMLRGQDPTHVDDAYTAMFQQFLAAGVTVIVTTLTPCAGYQNAAVGDPCTTGPGATVDAARQTANSGILGSAGLTCVVDADQVVSNGTSPEALRPAFDAGDGANLSLHGAGSGYAAVAAAITGPSGACTLAPAQEPFPGAG